MSATLLPRAVATAVKRRGLPERHYRTLSYSFSLRSSSPELGRRIDQLLEGFQGVPDPDSVLYDIALNRSRRRPMFEVHRDGECVQRSDSMHTIIDFVVWDVFDEAVERTDRFLALHASAASWGDRGILFPGAPGSGKSTLVAGLMAAGFDYHTDEHATIDLETGELHPCPKPVWLSPDSMRALSALGGELPPELNHGGSVKYFVHPDLVRPGGVATAPSPVRHIIVPHHEEGLPTVIEPMSRSEVVLMLADESFNFPRFGDRALSVLADVVAGARCHRLRMADLGEAVRLVRDLVGGDR